MRKRTSTLVSMLAVLAMLTGCGKVKYPAYYTLNLLAPPDPPASYNARESIVVREFHSPGYLRQGPIVYRTTPEEIAFYQYHRWAADPRKLVTAAVADDLSSSGRYAIVSVDNGHNDGDYTLTGELERLEESDDPDGVKVRVAISAQISRTTTGAVVWRNAVSEVGTVSKRTVPGVVSAMNQTMDLAIAKLLATVPTLESSGQNVSSPRTGSVSSK
jgi:ABC-type uncharacterized transport system auxiliary subunit